MLFQVKVAPNDAGGAHIRLSLDNELYTADASIAAYSLPQTSYLGFTGRTGGKTNNHWVRSVLVGTGHGSCAAGMPATCKYSCGRKWTGFFESCRALLSLLFDDVDRFDGLTASCLDVDPMSITLAIADADCSVCGDGSIGYNEECDDGSSNSNAPNSGCRTNCMLPRCGDGIVDEGEECDGTSAHPWMPRGNCGCEDSITPLPGGGSVASLDACQTQCAENTFGRCVGYDFLTENNYCHTYDAECPLPSHECGSGWTHYERGTCCPDCQVC
eukprot:SAG31_NODE_2168_length_6266_cov_11.946976_6_plen_272_part_00